ncbi:MAG: hypothetical protein JRI76_08235 [Deltaproteobacteria bacterium]|nr:hypothetical protein [Deltaproteobacteria bacterium]MBW2042007.1 hypothetical protein [Deltaproteobacteria bacterium]
MKNAQFSAQDIKKCCEKKRKLGIHFKGKKELTGWFKERELKICRVTIPKGRKPISVGTYKSIANQLKLTIDQFDDLLECPLDRNGYKKILKDNGIIPRA